MKTGTIFNCNPGGNLGWQAVITQTGTRPGHTYSLPKELWGFQPPQAGRLKLRLLQGGESAAAALQRPLTKLPTGASALGSGPLLTCHTCNFPPPSIPLLPPDSNPSCMIWNVPFKAAWLWVLPSGSCWVLSVSVCLFGALCGSLPRSYCFSLIMMEVLVLIK